jgi:hypothetical protein
LQISIKRIQYPPICSAVIFFLAGVYSCPQGTVYSPECAQGNMQGAKGILTELLPFTVQLGQIRDPQPIKSYNCRLKSGLAQTVLIM